MVCGKLAGPSAVHGGGGGERRINRRRHLKGSGRMSAGGDKAFGGTIGKTVAGSKPWWPPAPKPPAGAPNILVVLFDDVGFSDFGCYGSPIRTPTIDRLAAEGLRYSGFHTTAMCSTTRAALLTGRNHHSVGVGCLANFDSGYPGYRGKIAREAGTLAEMLKAHAYRNYMVGKWHVTPLTESGATGPFDGWPLGRGFDRFYGFLDAETDQYAPELVSDNTHIDPPGTYADGYHLTADLVDQSIRFIGDHIADRPDLPWLTWLALGACHAPHQAPADIIRGYDEVFAHGWDVEREQRLARQKALGIVPPETKMPARNDGVKAWDAHGADERRLFTRLQSAFAGMLDHADRHLARLIGFLEAAGVRDNTLILILSDNGASQEGGRSVSSMRWDRTISVPSRSRRRCEGSTTSAVRIPTATFRTAGRWRPTRRCGATSRTPMAAASAIPSSCHGRSGCRRRASCAINSSTPAIWCRPCSNSSASARRRRSQGSRKCRSRAKALPARSRTLPRRPNPRRNISRCSGIAGSGTAAGKRYPSTRRARRSRTTSGSCFISIGIFPRSTTSPRKNPDASLK
jgi:arylsulfatase A-like enzyme